MILTSHDRMTLARWACELNCFRWPEDFPVPKPEGWDLWTGRETKRGSVWHKELNIRFPEFRMALNAIRAVIGDDAIHDFWLENYVKPLEEKVNGAGQH